MRPSKAKVLTATGDVTTVDTTLKTVSLAAGSDAATVTVKAGGSGGTTVVVLAAATGTSESVNVCDLYCDGGVHATLSGISPSATFVYE